jgi:hypothetical protein
MAFTVGQSLWWVSSQRHYLGNRGVIVLVEKVGRRWITLSNGHRIDVNSWYADGGKYTSPGRIYVSQEDYENTTRTQIAWDAFKKRIDRAYKVPTSMTSQKIAEIERMIFGEAEESA